MSCGATDSPTDVPRVRALVIGYGSPIRGDDAIGPMAADRLESELQPAGVRVISRHILTADLVPDIVEADRVIFIDAAVDGAPGEIRCRELVPDPRAISTMAHFLDPRELLAWAEALYDSRPDAHLISVAGADFEFSHFELSSAVDRALPTLLDQVRSLVFDAGPVAAAGGSSVSL